MTEGRLLRRIVKAGARTGTDDFREAAEELIRDERAKRHHLLANDLERILYGEPSGPTQRPTRRPYEVPRDRERGLPLLEVREPVRDLQDIVLSDDNRSTLDEVLLEQSRSELFATYGLKAVSRLLFCGPPGCGKTLAAEVLAAELGVEIALIRFDGVVSSFLGETSANLRKVFDFLSAERFIALFDEVDAIGKEREDPAEHGELKRVVNSFLQMMDAYRGPSLIIAATNHERMLDSALWRRFEDVLLFERPTLEQIRQLISVKLRGVRYELPVEDRGFLNGFKGMTHADIERVLIRSIKSMVLRGREFLTLDIVEQARKKEESRMQMLSRL